MQSSDSKDLGPSPGKSPSPDNAPTQAVLVNVAKLYATTANLGLSGGVEFAPPPSPETGPISDAEILDVTGNYLPTEQFSVLRSKANPGQIIVLQGESGSGRRAAGICLVAGLPAFTSLIALSPVLSLEALAARSWSKGVAYLLLDHQADYGHNAAEVAWRSIGDSLATLQSILIVTTNKETTPSSLPFLHLIAWKSPEPGSVLLKLTEDAYHPADERLQAVLQGLPRKISMTRVKAVAHALSDGGSAIEALGIASDSVYERINGWFDSSVLRDTVEITVVAFLGSLVERSFEHHANALFHLIQSSIPTDAEADAEAKAQPTTKFKRRVLSEDDLLSRQREVIERGFETVVGFVDATDRPTVLTCLWERCSNGYWDAVHQWVDQLIQNGYSSDVGFALSVLSQSSALAIEKDFLSPWATGIQGGNAQVTVVLTLWHMSRRDQIAPIALQIAVDWINSGTGGQRHCAAIAFSGDLGIRFPGEAIRRLWQGIAGSSIARDESIIAASILFARLVELGEDPGMVYRVVLSQLRSRRSTAVRLREVRLATLQLGLEMLAASLSDGKSALFRSFHADQRHGKNIAELAIMVSRHRPFRAEALKQLRRGLLDLEAFGDTPVTEARVFGRVLFEVMESSLEAAAFARDFRATDRLARQGNSIKPAEAIAACLECFGSETQTKE